MSTPGVIPVVCRFGLCRDVAVFQVSAPTLGVTEVCELHVRVVLSWGLPEPILDAEVTLVGATARRAV